MTSPASPLAILAASIEGVIDRVSTLGEHDRGLLVNAASQLRQLSTAHAQNVDPASGLSIELRDWSWVDGDNSVSAGVDDPRWQPFVLEASLDPAKALSLRLHPRQGSHWDGPLMEIGIEINQGLPCLHLSASDDDGVALSVFSTPEGVMKARPGDGRFDVVRPDWMPEADEAFERPCPQSA